MLDIGATVLNRAVAGTHPIQPIAAEIFPSQFEQPKVVVTALDAERTFWEKATLLHAEYHRPADKPLPSRLTRHYYDIAMLARKPVCERAIEMPKLRERVVAHKSTYFRSGWASYETASPGTFCLLPQPNRTAELQRDYRQMLEMIMPMRQRSMRSC